MDMKFLDYYRENLLYLRGLGAEFAAEFPKIASRLELSSMNCQDPYIERLIEATAFLAARVEKRIDDGVPYLLESILSSISPRVLYPIASVGICQLSPNYTNPKIKAGLKISKNDKFSVPLQSFGKSCIYTPLWESTIHQISLNNAEYVTRDLSSLCPITKNDVAALKLTFKSESSLNLSENDIDFLDVFLNMTENEASQLQCQLIADLHKVYLLDNVGNIKEIKNINISIPALDGNNMIVSTESQKLHSLGILQEFLSNPVLFKFIRISNINSILRSVKSSTCSIIFTFKTRIQEFSDIIDVNSIKLWCVPLVNVFTKRSNRERIKGNFEHHIVPERTAPNDYEVFSVSNVDFFDDENTLLLSAKPFYTVSNNFGYEKSSDFVSIHRKEKNVSKSIVGVGSYSISDVFISVSGDNWHNKRDSITQFAADIKCTNGALPLLIKANSAIDVNNQAFLGANFIGTPSKPLPSLISNGAKSSWEKVAYIVMNISSVLWQDKEIPTNFIKKLISSYSILSPEETKRIIGGILKIETFPETFRYIYKNCNVYYEQGWNVKITLSEESYEGSGFFIFGYVLQNLINSFSAINSCIEVELYSDEKGFINKWTTLKS